MSRDEKLEGKVFKLPGGKEFKEEVDSLSIAQLESRITTMQKGLEESEEHREANEPLRRAKDEVAELNGPYNDVRKAVKIKTKYIIQLLRSKGGK
jgi:hypothetical protein